MITAVRVFIIDDHPVVRLGLKELMKRSRDVTVVGDAEDAGSATIDALQRSHADIVILDIRLKAGSGIDACRTIKRRLPNIRVVLLTAFWDDDLVDLAIDAGADGYLLKDAEQFDLTKAVLAVAAGHSFFDPAVAAILVRHARGDARRERASLSEQDTIILRHVAEGLTNKAIATSMYLSDHTVRDRVSRIMRTLGARNRTEAAQLASRRGLI